MKHIKKSFLSASLYSTPFAPQSTATEPRKNPSVVGELLVGVRSSLLLSFPAYHRHIISCRTSPHPTTSFFSQDIHCRDFRCLRNWIISNSSREPTSYSYGNDFLLMFGRGLVNLLCP